MPEESTVTPNVSGGGGISTQEAGARIAEIFSEGGLEEIESKAELTDHQLKEKAKAKAEARAELRQEKSEREPPTEDDALDDEDDDTPDIREADMEDEGTEATDDSEERPSGWDQLAKSLKMERDALDEIKVPVKVNGQTSDVTLGELSKGYSRDADYRAKTEALSGKAKDFQKWASDTQQQTRQQAEVLTNVFHTVLESFTGQAPDKQLLSVDPEEYARQRAVYAGRKEAFDEMIGPVFTQIDAMDSARSTQMKKMKSVSQNELRQVLPEYFHPEKGGEAQQRLSNFLVNDMKIEPEALETLVDPRMVRIADLAMKYHRLSEGKVLRSKKASPKGKALRAGTAQEKGGRDSRATRSRQRLRQTGRMEDAVPAIAALLRD